MKAVVVAVLLFVSLEALSVRAFADSQSETRLPIAKTVSCDVTLRDQDVPNEKDGYPTFTVDVNRLETVVGPGFYGTRMYTIPGTQYQVGVSAHSRGPKDDTPDFVQLEVVDQQRGVWIDGGPQIIPLLGTHAKPFLHDNQPTATVQYHLGPFPPKMGVLIPTEIGAVCWMN